MSININQVTDTHTPTTGLETISGSLLVTNGIKLPNTGGGPLCGKKTVSGPGASTTVSTTAVLSTSLIFLSYQNGSVTTPTPLQSTSITSGTSFDVGGGNGVDGWTFSWFIINP